MSELILTLYVAGETPGSRRAATNLREICEREMPGEYRIEVVDVIEHPAVAERAGILVTPTLVRRLPPPTRRVIGDLSDGEQVLRQLLDEVEDDAADTAAQPTT
ncbi:MAG: circadian clock KaiB family protein [Acidimicrobiia bacterium]|jgi:circadian clock protein KaiB